MLGQAAPLVGTTGVSRPVDQQRVANLLAVLALMVESSSAFEAVDRAKLEAEIVEGLGL